MVYFHSVSSTAEPAWVRRTLIFVALSFLSILIILPITVIFTEALHKGIRIYLESFCNKDALSAIKLTLIVAFMATLSNVIFGIAASWAITKFDFIGKPLLITLIDLPFAVSPVTVGLIYLLLFNAQTTLGQWLMTHNIKIMFAIPGLIIVTLFVTFPYVVRELIPLMQEQGTEEEEAAIMLGASGWTTFWNITLPNIKWGLLYGTLLCNARAMGEFGAVSIVSGHIKGETNTIPLYVEMLYNEYNFVAAFTMASILTLLALLTLLLKTILERKYISKGYLS